jgi:hypothetical protein
MNDKKYMYVFDVDMKMVLFADMSKRIKSELKGNEEISVNFWHDIIDDFDITTNYMYFNLSENDENFTKDFKEYLSKNNVHYSEHEDYNLITFSFMGMTKQDFLKQFRNEDINNVWTDEEINKLYDYQKIVYGEVTESNTCIEYCINNKGLVDYE